MLPNILQVFDELSKRFWGFVERRVGVLRILAIHYGQFALFLFFSIVRVLVLICQHFRWRRSGLAEKLGRIRQGLAYEESAHVLNVHWSCKATPTDKVRLMQFVATHHAFAHPKCVLADDWMIAEIMPDYALFVQLKKPAVEYTVRNSTFLWADMTYEARRIAVMPLTSLQRLSIEIGKPKDDGANVTFLWGSGRCGSTLIAKVVDAADPDHLVLSEPPIIMDLYSFKRRMRPRQFARFFECATRLLVKPVAGRSRLFIKPIFFVLNVAEDMHEVLPNARMLYSYRTPLRTIWGHERAFSKTPYYLALQAALVTNQWERGERLLGFHRRPLLDQVSNRVLGKGFFDLCCIVWADNYFSYQEQAKKFYFPAIIYDRLFDNPHQFCSEILSFAGADLDRLQDALDLLQSDSQDGSLFSQSLLKGLTVTPFTPSQKARTDRFCDALSLPRLELENGSHRPVQFVSSAPSSSAASKIQSCSTTVLENNRNFIIDPSQTIYEIMHAGGGGSSSPVSKGQPHGSTAAQKRPQFQPYYKPLPLQIIFSKD